VTEAMSERPELRVKVEGLPLPQWAVDLGITGMTFMPYGVNVTLFNGGEFRLDADDLRDMAMIHSSKTKEAFASSIESFTKISQSLTN
jgi:hypothetical protein